MPRGIYGGSFDPVHRGHVAVAEAVLAARGLDGVDLIPASSPPHKEGGCTEGFRHRVAMARRAVEGRPGLGVLDLEGRRPGPSYTFDTVEELRRRRPGVRWELLVGADMLADLLSWHRATDLVSEVLVVAFARPGGDLAGARRAFEAAFGSGRLAFVEAPFLGVSSTEVRRRLAGGEPVDDLLDPRVLAYIRQNRLYGVKGVDPRPPETLQTGA